MSVLLYISAALVVWRISKAVTDEEGPFSAFNWLRSQISQASWVGRGLWCLWCVSFWIGPLLALLLTWDAVQTFVLGWAWSSLAIVFDEVVSFIHARSTSVSRR